jgi:hypothetical protein
MAKLNLNFHQSTGRYNPTKYEIVQIESLALSIEAIIKVMAHYSVNYDNDKHSGEAMSNCLGVFNALELLIEPIVEYMGDYAGDTPEPEQGEAMPA